MDSGIPAQIPQTFSSLMDIGPTGTWARRSEVGAGVMPGWSGVGRDWQGFDSSGPGRLISLRWCGNFGGLARRYPGRSRLAEIPTTFSDVTASRYWLTTKKSCRLVLAEGQFSP